MGFKHGMLAQQWNDTGVTKYMYPKLEQKEFVIQYRFIRIYVNHQYSNQLSKQLLRQIN